MFESSLIGDFIKFDDGTSAEIICVDFETGDLRVHVVDSDGQISDYMYDEVVIMEKDNEVR